MSLSSVSSRGHEGVSRYLWISVLTSNLGRGDQISECPSLTSAGSPDMTLGFIP